MNAVEPTAEQLAIHDERALDLRILAPAGCGKTEALAIRIAGLIERGQVQPPERVLILTFSNRARDNARDRLRSHLSLRAIRAMVTVSNLHGFATRIIRAHGAVIGLPPDLEAPTSDWVSEQCRAHDLSFPQQAAAKKALQSVNQQPLRDDQVLKALVDHGNEHALVIERQRQAEGRLTYDDLLRLAELVLANDDVAALYRRHFACLVVDEFQDLTPQQMRVIQRIGHGRTTYAGDIAQGIYSFAGADPEAVLAAVSAETTRELPLTMSYRSSPAVLAAVNSLNARTGGAELSCAKPDSWPGGGLATGIKFSNVGDEAAWVVDLAGRILGAAPSQRIGIIARGGLRRRFIDESFEATTLPWHRWDDPLMDASTCSHVKKIVARVSVERFYADGIDYLIREAALETIDETDTRRGILDALGWATDLLNEKTPLDEISKRLRTAQSVKLLDVPGAHLLSAHVGKGQQFDWVIVVGLEDGHVPNFNAETDAELREEARVFSVMLSRARHGLAITRAESVPTKAGRVRSQQASQFLVDLREAAVLVSADAGNAWLEAADWSLIAAR